MSLSVTFTPTQADYVNAFRAYQLRQRRTRVFLAVLLVSFILGVVLLALPRLGYTQYGFLFILFGLVGGGYLLYWSPRTVGKQMQANKKLALETTWELNSSRIHMRSQYLNAKVLWATFQELLVTRKYYLLIYAENRRMFNILPRRAFYNAEQEAAFLKLAEKRLKVSR